MTNKKCKNKFIGITVILVLVFIVLSLSPIEVLIKSILTPSIQEEVYVEYKITEEESGEEVPSQTIQPGSKIITFAKALKYAILALLMILVGKGLYKKILKRFEYTYDAKKWIRVIEVIAVLLAVLTLFSYDRSEPQYYVKRSEIIEGEANIQVHKFAEVSSFLKNPDNSLDGMREAAVDCLEQFYKVCEILTIAFGVAIIPINYYQELHDEHINKSKK
ncbi:hypothetical protein M2150_002000 [Lachnospiraceae bacterium PM6-15]|uniref:Uncharacterized protein n=1 Tax=Ohessyouella blattaphilus TaxID=2949333 RepID=A0ABT1EFL5_9FIRM|nr:hypothetical protein [Ohessyouella blattaphilus]MCP1109495.1 hypothetical protein [Ohessyouella blattaphilus]MCR8562889.1 hypothetical protein [Ohessyouella blattaphilus]